MKRAGKSPRELLSEYRMYKAREILTTTDVSIGDTAQAVGYADRMVFSKAFRRWCGSSPSEYRKRASLPIKTGLSESG
jgi:AraC-like DNA-binding protein